MQRTSLRPALKRLLADVLSDERQFRAILVLDVSRWGRFQDLDQAAHYEYMCQEAGVNRQRQTQSNGSRWTHATVRRTLSNPLYVGDYVFGRKRNNLGLEVAVPETDWVRTKVLDPIIPLEMFEAAQTRLVNCRQLFTNEEILAGMSRLLAEKGVLTHKVIVECHYVSSPATIVQRFGSMVAAYQRIGYDPPKYYPPNPQGRRYTSAELLERLRTLHEDQGFLSVRLINDDNSLPSYNYICARVGGISKILAKMGLPVTAEAQRLATLKRTQRDVVGMPGRFKPRRHRNPDGTRVTNEQLVDHLKRLLSLHGYLTTEIISADPYCPDPQFFRRRLGSMPRAYALVGYAGSRREIAVAAHARSAATKNTKAQR